MKKLKRYCLPILLILLTPLLLAGQQNEFNWRIGVYGGIMTYQGDLSYRWVDPNPKLNNLLFENLDYFSYGLSLERKLSNAFSLGILWTEGQFIANDRTVDWDGALQPQNLNFERALNARTELRDASAYLTYHFDNGHLLRRRAFIAPYLKAGAGLTHFNVYGDLFQGPGQENRYFYWEDGLIRNQPPGTSDAEVIEQDGIFETKLNGLQTEGQDYNNAVLSLSGGLGIKFRLGRFNINLESMLRWVDTDYLDDVSGEPFPQEFDNNLQQYASNPAGISRERRGRNNNNDLYTFTSLSLQFNFGRKEDDFLAPAIVPGPLLMPAAAFRPTPEPQKEVVVQQSEMPTDTVQSSVADSLQMLVDSLRQQLSDVRSAQVRSDRETADSLRTVAKNLRLQADSLQGRADLLYSVLPDTFASGQVALAPTLIIRDTSVSTVFQDSSVVSEKERLDTTATDPAGRTETMTTSDTSQTDTIDQVPAMVLDRTGIQQAPATTDTVELDQEKPIPADTTAAGDSRPEEPTITQQPTDTAMYAEMIRLREQVRTLSTRIEERAQPDTALRQKVEDLEQAIRELRSETQAMQTAVLARPPVDTNLLSIQEQLNFYREELSTLQQQITEMEEEPQEEKQRLITQFETRLQEIERVDPATDRQRYEELQQEIDELRRQLNITTGVGAAAGVTAMVTRQRTAPVDSLAIQLQPRVDSLERALQQLQTTPILIDAEAAADTTLLQRIDRLNARLDSFRLQQRIDPTTDLLRATLRQQRQTVEQQQENIQDLRTNVTKLESQIADLRSTIKVAPSASLKLQTRIVFFDVGSFNLSSSARRAIDETAEQARENPGLQIQLKGFTDSSGSVQANRRLSMRRTLAVKAYLIQLGIDPARISTLPQGIDPDAVSPAYGRRVEILLDTTDR